MSCSCYCAFFLYHSNWTQISLKSHSIGRIFWSQNRLDKKHLSNQLFAITTQNTKTLKSHSMHFLLRISFNFHVLQKQPKIFKLGGISTATRRLWAAVCPPPGLLYSTFSSVVCCLPSAVLLFFFAATVICCHRLCEWQDLVVGWNFSQTLSVQERKRVRSGEPSLAARALESWNPLKSYLDHDTLLGTVTWQRTSVGNNDRSVYIKTLAVLLRASLLTLLCLISTIYHISNISIILRTLSTEKSWVAASWSPLGEIQEFDQVNPVSLSAVFFSR